ncbi:GLL3 protein, partial [Glareola pratincola]|nr:GLL3 protein [Glareola pratincola]
MKILYLLFSIFLLLIQGSAGNAKQCREQGGFCVFGGCHFPYKFVGYCSTFIQCC